MTSDSRVVLALPPESGWLRLYSQRFATRVEGAKSVGSLNETLRENLGAII